MNHCVAPFVHCKSSIVFCFFFLKKRARPPTMRTWSAGQWPTTVSFSLTMAQKKEKREKKAMVDKTRAKGANGDDQEAPGFCALPATRKGWKRKGPKGHSARKRTRPTVVVKVAGVFLWSARPRRHTHTRDAPLKTYDTPGTGNVEQGAKKA
nr:hypothetical protein [Pandoravirus massiliensis]